MLHVLNKGFIGVRVHRALHPVPPIRKRRLPVIAAIIAVILFALSAWAIVWTAHKSDQLAMLEEERQRRAEALVKGGSIFK